MRSIGNAKNFRISEVKEKILSLLDECEYKPAEIAQRLSEKPVNIRQLLLKLKNEDLIIDNSVTHKYRKLGIVCETLDSGDRISV